VTSACEKATGQSSAANVPAGQVAVLKSATVANEALQLQAAAAQRDLAAAQEAAATAASHQHRAAAAEKAAAEARKEAQSARAAAAAMEERLQAAEEEMDRITGALTLPIHLLPTPGWPRARA
jgi:hypothetical protein